MIQLKMYNNSESVSIILKTSGFITRQSAVYILINPNALSNPLTFPRVLLKQKLPFQETVHKISYYNHTGRL